MKRVEIMTITTKQKYIIGMLALVAAFSAGRFMGPKEVRIEEREVIRYRDTTRIDDKHNVRTRIIETLQPDGTKTVETIHEDTSQIVTDTKHELDSEKSKESFSMNKPDWSIGLYTTTQKSMLMTVDRRILGPIFLGVYGRSEMPVRFPIEAGVGLRMGF
jgi:hypothetical protein